MSWFEAGKGDSSLVVEVSCMPSGMVWGSIVVVMSVVMMLVLVMKMLVVLLLILMSGLSCNINEAVNVEDSDQYPRVRTVKTDDPA